jgi:ribonuclease D
LPSNISLSGDLAVDTETKGLRIYDRDRLCVVQLSDGQGDAHVVRLDVADFNNAPNLKAVLSDDSRCKIFHYARFDVGALKKYLGIEMHNIYCTKIASKLVRTYTDRHGLKNLCSELIKVDISKQQQCSDWSAKELSPEQVDYAASDVLHLHALREKLNEKLVSENRVAIAQKCFDFIPTRALLDEGGWESVDIFSHA